MNSIKIAASYRISHWDAAIVAAAQVLGAKILYTEDPSHGQAYGSITAINPFIEEPRKPGFQDNKQTAFTKD
jgi:predicted nucleic acid-binding protein